MKAHQSTGIRIYTKTPLENSAMNLSNKIGIMFYKSKYANKSYNIFSLNSLLLIYKKKIIPVKKLYVFSKSDIILYIISAIKTASMRDIDEKDQRNKKITPNSWKKITQNTEIN